MHASIKPVHLNKQKNLGQIFVNTNFLEGGGKKLCYQKQGHFG
jgi:hypothetical protein